MQAAVRNNRQLNDRRNSMIISLTIISLLYGRPAFYLIKNLAHSLDQRAIHRATAGALMAATAKTLGHARHIEFSLAAQAHSKTSVGLLAEEYRHLNFANRKHVIDQAFAVFFLRIATFHLLLRHPSPGHVAFGVQVAQRLTEQPHLGHRVGEIN